MDGFSADLWTSLGALQRFVYRSEHVEFLRARSRWFEPIEGPILALWWVRAGEIPTVTDARERLQHLKEHGPTPRAFTFKATFPTRIQAP